jgi:hypothetical protein
MIFKEIWVACDACGERSSPASHARASTESKSCACRPYCINNAQEQQDKDDAAVVHIDQLSALKWGHSCCDPEHAPIRVRK